MKSNARRGAPVRCNTYVSRKILALPKRREIWSSERVYLYIYKIKVLSIHWYKSRHILVAHVLNKVMNENNPQQNSCLSVCFRGFREKLLTIHLKTAAGIVMKFHIWIRYLLTYVFNYITFWYLDPKITPKLLTLQQIVSWAKL